MLVLFIFFASNECFTNSNLMDGVFSSRFTKGQPYGEIREKLIEEGWDPVVSPDSDVCMEGDVRCANRPEMEACSGTGLAPCKFVWSKDGYNLNVFTVGMDATDEGDAAFDGVEIVELNSEK